MNAAARLLLVAAVALLGACAGPQGPRPSAPGPEASAPTQAPPARRGGYYLDDGPGDGPVPDIASIPEPVPRAEPLHPRANRPYVVFGKQYVPRTELAPYRERGVGSWYGRKFHGNPTSIGERYDMYAMTAAHPTLPIPSYARVTNVSNGRSVVVRVNDRGPFLHGRVIDLSYAAAAKLGYVNAGSAEVEVELITDFDTDRPTMVAAAPGQPASGARGGAGALPAGLAAVALPAAGAALPPLALRVETVSDSGGGSPAPGGPTQGPDARAVPATRAAPRPQSSGSASPGTSPAGVAARPPVPSANDPPRLSVQTTVVGQGTEEERASAAGLAAGGVRAAAPPAASGTQAALPATGPSAQTSPALASTAVPSPVSPGAPPGSAGVGASRGPSGSAVAAGPPGSARSGSSMGPASSASSASSAGSVSSASSASSAGRAAASAESRGFFVQLGAFASRENAEAARQRLAGQLDWIADALGVLQDGGVFKLQAGPYPQRGHAQSVVEQIRAATGMRPFTTVR